MMQAEGTQEGIKSCSKFVTRKRNQLQLQLQLQLHSPLSFLPGSNAYRPDGQ